MWFGTSSAGPLREVVARLAAEASRHLQETRALAAGLPRAARPAFLAARLAARHLSLLERAGHDPCDPKLQRPQTGKAWRLLWAALSGRL